MKRREFLKTAGAVTGGFLVLGQIPTFSAFAQSKTPKRGGTLIWGHSETTQNMDIHQTGTASTLRFMTNIHETIVKADKNFNMVPGLAERFEVSSDGLTYTFVMRKNVKFHNGKTLSANDVKYSFERIMNPDTGATNREVFNNVKEIAVVDEHTVQLKMAKIHAPLLARLGDLGAGTIMPEGSGETQGSHPIGAGPFKFA